ncbi:unnamed protein product [Ostreobium quekettii]|uniref:Protein phosphatase n=1 Tax=Ostreobium quekettii TaxID=121088 RepID=A0A8S1IXY9_9CHLO|nr:unnamed protein product [Ostreobium quekettii]|eukprot:evm.model.scf_1180.4 EVM.evm.TU.scf_1180.4   scf_1180:40301-41464(-)
MLLGAARGRLQSGGRRGLLGGALGRQPGRARWKMGGREVFLGAFGGGGLIFGDGGGGGGMGFGQGGGEWRRLLAGVGGVGLNVAMCGKGKGRGRGEEPGCLSSSASEVGDVSEGVKSGQGEAKGRKGLTLVSGCCMMPHPDKAYRGGEDAFFIAENGMAIGVADGVGAWALSGIDAGVYARALMAHAREAAADFEPGPEAPREVLRAAYAKTTSLGSSTACVLILDGRASILYAANVGDSGFMVVRGREAMFKSPAQTWNFNCPYQLGRDTRAYQGPDEAQSFAIRVRAGDAIVAATDGVFDNLFAEECVGVVAQAQAKGMSAGGASKALAQAAFARAGDRRAVTPFALEARANGILYNGGGKMDDITVVVSYVTPAGGGGQERSKL